MSTNLFDRMKIAHSLTDSDRQLVKQYLEDFVPHEIFDIHTHPFKAEHFKAGAFDFLSEHAELDCEDHRTAGPAKILMIRKMLPRGYLMSSQLYVMQAHTRTKVDAMISKLDEVLGELMVLNDSQRLVAEAGVQTTSGGFARLA
jgi:hypothetical protein